MADVKTFTHKDLAGLLGVSETTVKSYRRKFPGCIPVANQGKPIRFTGDSLKVATRIRDFFETGMSVADVRARLCGEFSWITPEVSEAPAETSKEQSVVRGKAVTPEITAGVSNMAKSMVAMTQQQKAILERMQGIEVMLQELGLQGTDLDALRAKSSAAAKKREEALENRLDRLDGATAELAATVQSLAGELGRFLNKRAKAAEEWQKEGATALAEAARLASGPSEVSTSVPEERTQAPVREGTKGKVIMLRPENAQAPKSEQGERNVSGMEHSRPSAPSAGFAPAPSEPPRSFLSLPLVARTEQGQYISVGGKNRGRFSINDLKAMLIYGYTPPNHFTLSWEGHGEGWWLTLSQEQGERHIQLLLMELPTQKGGSVAEILQVKQQGKTLHPAEVCSIIDSFGA